MKNIFVFFLLIGLISCGGDTAKVEESKTRQTVKRPTPPKTAIKKNNSLTSKVNSNTAAKSNTGPYKAKNEGWHVNLDVAYQESQKTGKPIMANFTGSDWCGWCKRLDRCVFEKNVVLLELDFPRRFRVPADIAQQNRGLQQSLGVRGYPTIWLFDLNKDAEGKLSINPLGKSGYTKTVNEFTSTFERYMSARG